MQPQGGFSKDSDERPCVHRAGVQSSLGIFPNQSWDGKSVVLTRRRLRSYKMWHTGRPCRKPRQHSKCLTSTWNPPYFKRLLIRIAGLEEWEGNGKKTNSFVRGRELRLPKFAKTPSHWPRTFSVPAPYVAASARELESSLKTCEQQEQSLNSRTSHSIPLRPPEDRARR